jgi:hypothetical protein
MLPPFSQGRGWGGVSAVTSFVSFFGMHIDRSWMSLDTLDLSEYRTPQRVRSYDFHPSPTCDTCWLRTRNVGSARSSLPKVSGDNFVDNLFGSLHRLVQRFATFIMPPVPGSPLAPGSQQKSGPSKKRIVNYDSESGSSEASSPAKPKTEAPRANGLSAEAPNVCAASSPAKKRAKAQAKNGSGKDKDGEKRLKEAERLWETRRELPFYQGRSSYSHAYCPVADLNRSQDHTGRGLGE